MSPIEIGAIVSLIAAVVAAIGAAFRIKPDRDAVLITSAQGAATILNDLVKTLREEVQHERERAEKAEKRIMELEHENQGLRAKHGTRRSDARSSGSHD